ncbi:MAG: polysaccharide pyruvyl transferase family protein, partial [Rhodocyclaceae bacterium]|nr:polysaccharide pyruvyl transferase family protein [Rhodocyclaceae bacterium]
MLLGEIADALFSDQGVVFAGLAERDLRAYGGRQVRPIAALARHWGEQAAEILHVGGEILSCSLYQAAVMLQNEAEAQLAIARYERAPEAGHAWAAGITGLEQPLGYLVPRSLFRHLRWIGHMGIGGADWASLPNALRQQAVGELRQSQFVWVRDNQTYNALAQAGITAWLAPDPAVLTRRLFGAQISARAQRGEVHTLRERFPAGYLAIQFSADFGDDVTLDLIGHQLAQLQAATGYGCVLFRAGAAIWHDDSAVYRRLMARYARQAFVLFESLDLWDICALLAASQGYAGSSLHGRIIAAAFGRPAVSLVLTLPAAAKLCAYVRTWHDQAALTLTTPDTLAQRFLAASKAEDDHVARQ